MTWDAVKSLLRAAKESTDVNPIVKSAVGGVVFLLDAWEAVKEVEEDYKHLKALVTEFAEVIDEAARKEKYGLRSDLLRRGDSQVHGATPSEMATPSILTDENGRRSPKAMPKEAERALSDLNEILKRINEYLGRLFGSRDPSGVDAQPARCQCYNYCRRTLGQLMRRYSDQSDLRKLERDFREALERFKFSSNLRTTRVLRKTYHQLESMRNAQERSSGTFRAISARLATRLLSLSAGQPGRQFSAEEFRLIVRQVIQEEMRSSPSASEGSARIDALEQHVIGIDGRLKDTIADAQKYYITEQHVILDRISEANRSWERMRQEERAADRHELDAVKESVSRIKAHIDAIEAQEVVDLVAMYRLVETMAHKVDNMHASDSERNKSHAETTQLLADLRKHINAAAQAAAAPLDLSRTSAGETPRDTAAQTEDQRTRGNETRYAPTSPSWLPPPRMHTPRSHITPWQWDHRPISPRRREEDDSDNTTARKRKETHRAPLRRQTHPNPRPPAPARI